MKFPTKDDLGCLLLYIVIYSMYPVFPPLFITLVTDSSQQARTLHIVIVVVASCWALRMTHSIMKDVNDQL